MDEHLYWKGKNKQTGVATLSARHLRVMRVSSLELPNAVCGYTLYNLHPKLIVLAQVFLPGMTNKRHFTYLGQQQGMLLEFQEFHVVSRDSLLREVENALHNTTHHWTWGYVAC